MDDKEIIRSALRCWGPQHQVVVAIEEMSELQKELCKLQRGKVNMNHIAEEIADVEIMLAQLKEAFNLYHSVEGQRYFKLQRLEMRIHAIEEERRNGRA